MTERRPRVLFLKDHFLIRLIAVEGLEAACHVEPARSNLVDVAHYAEALLQSAKDRQAAINPRARSLRRERRQLNTVSQLLPFHEQSAKELSRLRVAIE